MHSTPKDGNGRYYWSYLSLMGENKMKRKKALCLIFICSVLPALGLLGFASTAAAGKPLGTWTTLTPVPANFIGVEGPAVGSIGNQIIVAMGYDSGSTNTTRIYTIDSDSWSIGANAPGTAKEGTAVTHDGHLYALGGNAGGTANWAYDPATDTWNGGLAQMPTGRSGLAAAVVGHAIYAIGGRTNNGGPCSGFGTELAIVERYEIHSDTWSTVASLPTPRSDLGAATIGGKIYVFGGCRSSSNILADVDVYDPVTDTWSTAPTDLPTARAAMYAVASKGNEVHVIGGWDGIGSGLSTNEAYKVSTDIWTTGLPAMPTPRAEFGAADHGGRIYIVGGAQPGFGASVVSNEVFKP
jgi:hypothetical protein